MISIETTAMGYARSRRSTGLHGLHRVDRSLQGRRVGGAPGEQSGASAARAQGGGRRPVHAAASTPIEAIVTAAAARPPARRSPPKNAGPGGQPEGVGEQHQAELAEHGQARCAELNRSSIAPTPRPANNAAAGPSAALFN